MMRIAMGVDKVFLLRLLLLRWVDYRDFAVKHKAWVKFRQVELKIVSFTNVRSVERKKKIEHFVDKTTL